MKTIIAFTSHDSIMGVGMPPSFAAFLMREVQNENVLIGSKLFEQDMQETPMKNIGKTYILSRSRKFTGTKHISDPKLFKEGYIIGGKSTISSMLPFADQVILGKSTKDEVFGEQFPSLEGFELSTLDVLPDFSLFVYEKKR